MTARFGGAAMSFLIALWAADDAKNELADKLFSLIPGVDLSGIRGVISAALRALGIGPHADEYAFWIVILLFVLAFVGYIANAFSAATAAATPAQVPTSSTTTITSTSPATTDQK